MTEFRGRFVWYELMTSDPAAAKDFYGDVVGWTAQDVPMPDMTYTLMKAGARQVAGLMPVPPQAAAADAPPSWIGYVSVDDVDAGAAKVQRLGGLVHHAPDDIPGVGRFAVVGDPRGAAFALFKPAPMDAPLEPADPRTPGHVAWHELYTPDVDEAFGFYAEMFGWTKAERMETPMGPYQLFAVHGEPAGALMTLPLAMPRPAWLFYFQVGAFDPALERVKAGGGQVLAGPMEVPTGDWIIQGRDPQGAMFALLGRR